MAIAITLNIAVVLPTTARYLLRNLASWRP